MSEALAQLAARLRLLRMEKKLTYVALERRSGLGHTTVSQALNGRKVPTEATLVSLAKALGADAGALMVLRDRAAAEAAPVAARQPSDEDAAFEERYHDYIVERHSRLTIVGLDLQGPQAACWPLDTAYLSLELAVRRDGPEAFEGHGPGTVVERAEQALAGRQRTLVRGLAGSGKTTLLQWLAVIAARGNPPEPLAHLRGLIPFVLPLRTLDLQSALPSSHRFLEATRSALASSQPLGWADRVLAAGRGLILVDGIDEVPGHRREQTREWLRDLLAAYPRSHFMVTTRPSAVPERWLDGSGFTELTVRPMNRKDVFVFARRWHAAAGAGSALEDRFKDAVRAQPALAQLATTPLMCALMCALHRDRHGHLPRSRTELYEAALAMLLVRRDDERGIEAPEGISLTYPEAVQLLQRLAYWLIRNGQAAMDVRDALTVMQEALPSMASVARQGNPEQVLRHLLTRSGLLRQPSADTIDFVHRTFQDYLGAKAAVEARDLGVLAGHAHDDQWEDVIRMAVAHARPAERATLLRRVIARGDRTAKHGTRLHLLAMACLEQATELDPEVRAAVEQRGAALLPPRSSREAEQLARVGPVVLGLLPGPEGLEEDEAVAVVETASAVGGDAALALLKRYRMVPGVARFLADARSSFDAREFAEEILEHLPANCRVVVRDHDALHLLPRLPQKSWIGFAGDFSADEMVHATTPAEVQRLEIFSNTRLDELDFLRQFDALQELILSSTPLVQDLGPLDGSALKHLRLWHPAGRLLGTLSELPALERLSLNPPFQHFEAGLLPRLPALRGLHITSSSLADGPQFRGISELTGLTSLTVPAWGIPEPAREELTALPSLSALDILDQDALRLEASPPLPAIRQLTLTWPRGLTSVEPIVKVFPGLQELEIIYYEAATKPSGATLDLTPLAGTAGLRITVRNAHRVTGLDRFPPGAVTLSPRPRP
ncbi:MULTISPECIES: NACHT domain-containing protein [Streptomyces]|uniref:NACHT domain-containing protein n=1 Tax=Streptomyces luteosporeus TaxID=173856 RepID=A0ABN3TLY1_9ACTN